MIEKIISTTGIFIHTWHFPEMRMLYFMVRNIPFGKKQTLVFGEVKTRFDNPES